MTQKQINAPKSTKSPTELLEAQYETLAAMYANQAEMDRRILAQLMDIYSLLSSDLMPIKIEDVNMPFTTMVGFMVKVAVASIPAALIFIVLFAFAWMVIITGGIASLGS